MRLSQLVGPLALLTLTSASATGTAATKTTHTKTTAPVTTATCAPTALPTNFLITLAEGSATTYGLSVGRPTSNNETHHAASASKAAVFSVEDVCLGADDCGINQLVYNDSAVSPNVVYGAYVGQDGGAVTFLPNQTAAVDSGLAIVTATWSQFACEIVLIPYLDHDVSNVFDCGGKISLFGSSSPRKGCKAVNLGFDTVKK